MRAASASGPGGLLVLGGSGRLGTALARELESRGRSFAAPPRAEIDLEGADLEAIVAASGARAVINAAAYNDVDGAEREPAAAFRLNRDVPAALARACARAAIPLVHVSTDYVFDGRRTEPYCESDPVGPLQGYGRSKLEGERAVLEAHPTALVVRTSTVFGADRRGGSDYVVAVLRQARRAGALEVVELPVSCPTYARDLARAILALVEVGARGLVHVAGRGACTRLELAAAALAAAGLAGQVALRTRPAAPGAAPRPAYSALDTSRAAELLGAPLPAWQDALGDYVCGR